MSKFNNNQKVDIKLYPYIIRKMIYLFSDTKLKFAIKIQLLSKYNTYSRIGFLKSIKKS